MTAATRELVDHVTKALIRVDASTEGTPDYDVLAETAVVTVLEQLALQAMQRLKRDVMEGK